MKYKMKFNIENFDTDNLHDNNKVLDNIFDKSIDEIKCHKPINLQLSQCTYKNNLYVAPYEIFEKKVNLYEFNELDENHLNQYTLDYPKLKKSKYNALDIFTNIPFNTEMKSINQDNKPFRELENKRNCNLK